MARPPKELVRLQVPGLAVAARPRAVRTAETTLPSGLRVVAARRPGVPMVELRLRIPFLSPRPEHSARASLLSETLLTGTATHDRLGIAMALQELGADIGVSQDADRLTLSGSALANRLPELLALVADVVTTASYPASEVAGERDRLLERIVMARSQAGTIANEALARRMAPGHPYGELLPSVDELSRTTAAQLRKLHADRVRPDGAALVIVGDINAERALDMAARALQEWTGSPATKPVPPPPQVQRQPMLILDRPGSVQTSLRFGGDAVGRLHPDYPALQLANLIFGGFFSSRWVENIREDKGYTYSPRSSLDHSALGSSLSASADVATEVTAPAVVETLYELGKISTLPVTEAELESVRQYAIGTQALSIATQAGLASTLSMLLAAGTNLDWLTEHRARLLEVSVADVAAAAAKYLAPERLIAVAVGDASAITEPLAAVIDVQR